MSTSIADEVRNQIDRRRYAAEMERRVQEQSNPEPTAPAARLQLVADRTRWGLALYYLHEHRRAYDVLKRALQLSAGLDLDATLAEMHHCFGLVTHVRGLDHKAELELQVASKMFRALSDPAGQARVADTLGTVYALLGHAVQARESYQHSLRLKSEVGDVAGQAITCGKLGKLFQNNGQMADAIAMFNKDRELIGRLSADGSVPAIRSYQRDLALVNLALAEIYGGSEATMGQALDLVESAQALDDSQGNVLGIHIARTVRARILLKRDRLEAAAAELADLLKSLPREDAFEQLRGEALCSLADVRERQGNLKDAAQCARSAVEQFRAGGYGREEIEGLLKLADLLAQSNKKQEALKHLRAALERALKEGLQPLVTRAELTIRRLDPFLWYRLVSERFNNFDPTEIPAERPVLTLRHGERRPATVMFADVSGYTRMMARREHEGEVAEMMADLNEILTLMSESVHNFGGMVDKFIGDCIMAVFFPTPGKTIEADAARNAVHAAQEIQAGFDTFNRARHFLREADRKSSPEHEPWPPILKVHIGVSTGTVTVGNVGSYHRLSYTVIGDAVNMASRLEGQATAGEILVDENTWRLVADWFEGERGEYAIKGKDGVVAAYRIRPGLVGPRFAEA